MSTAISTAMSQITIEFIIPLAHDTETMSDGRVLYNGFTVLGATAEGGQHISVYYEIPDNGVMSANLPIISDEQGKWRAVFHGKFRSGTEITAHAQSDGSGAVQTTKTL